MLSQLRTLIIAGLLLPGFVLPVLAQESVQLNFLGRYETGIFADGAAEIVAYDKRTYRAFVVNGADASIDAIDLSDPTNPTLLFSIDVSPYGAIANSVAINKNVVAAAVENDDKQLNGSVVFFDTDGNFLNAVTAGALPDMLTFSPNGKYLLVANEGEPNDDYTVDPEGTVSIINLRKHPAKLIDADVTTVSFAQFNNATLDASIRIFGPGASVAQDLEPEYIAVSADSRTAWVSLQENNAFAIIDIPTATVTELTGLGFKDHSLPENALDASNRDDVINITTWPTLGMYQPDAIASYRVRGKDYIVSANEGDARDYDGYSEEERIGDLDLDPSAFPNAEDLQEDENLGRLNSTTATGDADGDGLFEEVYSYGARSFSIWNAEGDLIYDSGDILEQITSAADPDNFNSDDEENDSFDNRSDDKGPEPEGVVIGKVKGSLYAFVGLERVGGIVIFDVTNPYAPSFVQYVNTRDFNGDPEASTSGDLSPEGLAFVDGRFSPTGQPLLIVSYEVSGTTTVFEIDVVNADADYASAAKTADFVNVTTDRITLSPAYPNPFNHTTVINFEVPRETHASLKVYDTMGREVTTLVNRTVSAGSHSVSWNGNDASQQRVASGTYFYRLEVDGLVQTRSTVLVQ